MTINIATLPVGTKVRMVKCLEAETYKEKIRVTRSKPRQIACGERLVLPEDFSGGFAVKFLEIVS